MPSSGGREDNAIITIIAGSRGLGWPELQIAIAACPWTITEVVSGHAPRGIDPAGERWAEENHLPLKQFPADWSRYGLSAGYRRNAEMADYAEALVAVWNRTSPGTKNMIEIATKKKLRVFVWMPPEK